MEGKSLGRFRYCVPSNFFLNATYVKIQSCSFPLMRLIKVTSYLCVTTGLAPFCQFTLDSFYSCN